HAARRAIDLRLARWNRLLADDARPRQIHQLQAAVEADGSVEVVLDVIARRASPSSPELASAADELRRRYATWALMTVEAFAALFKQSHDHVMRGEYARRVCACGRHLLLATDVIALFHVMFRPVLTRQLDLRARHPIQQL